MMSRIGIEYSLSTAGLALLVGVAGGAVVGSEAVPAVWMGALAGLAVQVAVFWALFLGLLRGRWTVAHAAGVAVRFAAVAVVALVGVPAWGYSPAPLLFSLVACLVGSTFLEPVFLKRLQAGPDTGELAAIRIKN